MSTENETTMSSAPAGAPVVMVDADGKTNASPAPHPLPITPMVPVGQSPNPAAVQTAPVQTAPAQTLAVPHSLIFTSERKALLAETIMMGASEGELDLFALVCSRTGLDPFAKQIHAIKRKKQVDRKWVDFWTFQVAIDGFRLIAERTGKYRGQTVPLFCGPDLQWQEVWLSKTTPPTACKVGVMRVDFDEPLYAIALYDEYVQTKDVWENNVSTGEKVPNTMWAKMPAVMLAKVAEALALRKSFPQEMSGLYSDDEMGQADNADRQEHADNRRAASTRGGERAAGAGIGAKAIAAPAPVTWTGEGATFPYDPYRGIPLSAKYNAGTKRTRKGKNGEPDLELNVGGEYVISETRLNQCLGWAEGKLSMHEDAERAGGKPETDLLDSKAIERFAEVSQSVRDELRNRGLTPDPIMPKKVEKKASAVEGEQRANPIDTGAPGTGGTKKTPQETSTMKKTGRGSRATSASTDTNDRAMHAGDALGDAVDRMTRSDDDDDLPF